MKKIALTIIMSLFLTNIQSQNFEELYKKIEKFDKQEQFDSVDKDILQAINYLLTHKYAEKSKSYYYALESMIKWMDGTSKYSIIIGGKLTDDIGKKTLMINMYMASMAKYQLNEKFEKNRYLDIHAQKEKKFMERDVVREIQYKGGILLFEYLGNFSGVKPNKKLKKAMKAYKKGKLYEYMYD